MDKQQRDLLDSTENSAQGYMAAWMEWSLRENGSMYVYGSVPLLFTWSYHNIVLSQYKNHLTHKNSDKNPVPWMHMWTMRSYLYLAHNSKLNKRPQELRKACNSLWRKYSLFGSVYSLETDHCQSFERYSADTQITFWPLLLTLAFNCPVDCGQASDGLRGCPFLTVFNWTLQPQCILLSHSAIEMKILVTASYNKP